MPAAIFLPYAQDENMEDVVRRAHAANPGKLKLFANERQLAWLPRQPKSGHWVQVAFADRRGELHYPAPGAA